ACAAPGRARGRCDPQALTPRASGGVLRHRGAARLRSVDAAVVGRRADHHAGHLLVRARRPAVRGPLVRRRRPDRREDHLRGVNPDVTRSELTYAECVRYRTRLPATAPDRFQRIFTSRPGYPLLTVPFDG